MLRRLGFVLLLPVVWIPILVLVITVRIPWWAWAFGALFWLLWRLRKRHTTDDTTATPDGPQYAPIRTGGGF